MMRLEDYPKEVRDGVEYTLVEGIWYPSLNSLEDLHPYRNFQTIERMKLPRWAKMKYDYMMENERERLLTLQKKGKALSFLKQVNDTIIDMKLEMQKEIVFKAQSQPTFMEKIQEIEMKCLQIEEILIETLTTL